MKKIFVSMLFVFLVFALFIVNSNNVKAKNLQYGFRTATLPTHYVGLWEHHLYGHRYIVMKIKNRHDIHYTDDYETNKSITWNEKNGFLHFIVAKNKSLDKSSKRFYMYNPKENFCTLYTKHGHVYVDEGSSNMMLMHKIGAKK